MSNTALIQAKVEPRLKRQAQKCLAGFGMDFSTAIRIYLHKIVSTKGIPFTVDANAARVPEPNAAFAKVLREIEDDIANNRNLSPEMNVNDALAYLDKIGKVS